MVNASLTHAHTSTETSHGYAVLHLTYSVLCYFKRPIGA